MYIIGAKKGQKQQKPNIAPDSAQSRTYISILYGLAEGEIEGFDFKNIYLDDTRIQNDDGSYNFNDLKIDTRTGTQDQEHIEGFPDVSSEKSVNVELTATTPWSKTLNNLDLSAVRIRLRWGALRTQNQENGDVTGVTIAYAIDVKTDNGPWQVALDTNISEKTSDNYERVHRVDLPPATKGWQVRVRRITPNAEKDNISDKMYVAAITEVIDLKLRYPNTALLGLRYNAEQFSNVAKMAVRAKGLRLQVPSNYNAVTRTYDGIWDGTFKEAYTNNPAWIYYDLCTKSRYALGDRLKEFMIDKWSLYRLAQYCDQMVDDGKGGKEPRFTLNVYIQSAEDAFAVLSKVAGVFRAISFWSGNQIVCDADMPQEPMYTFSRANVINGEFNYTGTRARDRHTVAKVAWDNPANRFKTEYEFVRDEKAIAELGVRIADIQAWGCTSRGQAQRAGQWALKSEQLETRMVSFKVGLDGYIPLPGKVIEISDDLFAGRANGGRVVNVDSNTITLDREVTAKVGDKLIINDNTGKSQSRQIVSVSGHKVTVRQNFENVSPENVWAIDSADLKTMKFRVMSITQDDGHQFTISAVQYEASKYDAIDHGAYIDERPISVINPTVQAPVDQVTISSEHKIEQGITVTTLLIGYSQAKDAVKYVVEWKRNDGSWIKLPETGVNLAEVRGVYAGEYIARVTAVSAFGQASTPTYSVMTKVAGKQGRPKTPAILKATGVLFGMELNWSFASGSDDTAYTEIELSPNGRSNITKLGTFAYPTNKHEITGLQGNLTQFYRARIVDKLGNTSDWTAWVSGTTSANADKVLEILSGQISESHLDQTLRTPISKVEGLQNTLNTAVSNITAERNRITSAIRDITALQADKNAKTQQLANLTQTINGHTSNIRELGATTGDLSQKYTQLKTASDNANSEITAIKQTQAGQAVEQSSLKARFDSLKVGGRNLLLSSGMPQTGNYGMWWKLSQPPKHGEDVVITLWGELSPNHTDWQVYNTSGSNGFGNAVKIADGVWQIKTKWKEVHANTHLAVYQIPNGNGNRSRIDKIKLEVGNVGTDWTPAPEDVNVDLSPYATVASFDEFKRTQAAKDKTEAEKVTTLQTTVGSHTSSIQQHAQSLNGLSAQYTIKVQSGNVVSGIGLASNNGISDFAVRADKFYIAPPSGGKGNMPFVVQTTPRVINGVTIPAGTYINSAYIANASIDIAKINKASIQSLSALSANIGTLTTSDSRGTFTYTGSRIELRDPQGRLLMEMGLL